MTHQLMVKTVRANRLMSIFEVAEEMRRLSNDNIALIENKPQWCPQCESMIDAMGRCSSQCDRWEKL